MSRSDRMLLAAIGGAVILALAAASILLMPMTGEAAPPAEGNAALLIGTPTPTESAGAAGPSTGLIVVDVEGAVAQPGIRELPAGARVADAIDAAGGYAADVDLAATAATINLAQALADGEQIVVPRAGESASVDAPAPATAGGAAGESTGGLVNLNTATPEQLEALPGIGEVTVQKILTARQERPFASLEEAVERGVLNRGQLEDIQGLATAG